MLDTNCRTIPFLHHRIVREGTLTGFPHSGTSFPWESPGICLAYFQISLKAPAATVHTAVRSVSAAAPCPQQRPTNDSDQPTQIMADQRSSAAENPEVPQVIDSRVRTCMMRQPSTRPRQQPSVVLIGSSLVRDQGTKLRKEGVDCECYTIGGGTIPHIKSRIPHILNDRCQPNMFIWLVVVMICLTKMSIMCVKITKTLSPR